MGPSSGASATLADMVGDHRAAFLLTGLALALASCGPPIVYRGDDPPPSQTTASSDEEPESTPTAEQTSPPPAEPDTEPPQTETGQTESGEETQSPPRPCTADADHCCMPDGRIVRPGGCQPSYPSGVQPATRRGPDGRCEQVPCTLRCLSEAARIDTPEGPRVVTSLRVGDAVYTRDARGRQVARPVLRVGGTRVAGPHEVVELALADGRVVRASAGHPLASGAPLGEVRVGDVVDGAEVVGARTIPYGGAQTWDLLPAGPTGIYWADGVPLGSTLMPR